MFGTQGTDANTTTDTNNIQDGNSIAGETYSDTGKSHIENMGLAVFKGDVLVGELNGIQTVCHLIVTNSLKNYTLSITNPFDSTSTVNLYITLEEPTKNSVKIENGSPYVVTNAKIDAQVLAMDGNSESLDESKIASIEQHAASYLQEQINNYFYKTSKEYKSDIAGLRKTCYK